MQEKIIRQSVENYFLEDRIVMLDESLMRIKGVMFFIYDLIYFGNKIVVSEEMIKKLELYRNRIAFQVLSNNSSYLLESIKKDRRDNYIIVDISEYGKKSSQRIINYLKENDNIIYLLESKKFYDRLKKEGVEQLKLLDIKEKILSFCKNRDIKFETIGMIKHEKTRMCITKKMNDALVKVYEPSGKEKEGNTIVIDVNDLILIRSEKKIKYSFNLYRIISRHTRHQAVKILWTDIEKGTQSNFYVDRLEEKYQNIIKENVS